MRGLRALLLVGCLSALACPGTAQWRSWIEVRVERKDVSARIASAGRVVLCDGGNATVTVDVEGGTGPWQVVMHRNGEFYSRLKISEAESWSTMMLSKSVRSVSGQTTLEGTYTLKSVCDANYCNGTVANTSLLVELAVPPTARISPPCTPKCIDEPNESAHFLELTGTPPFHVHMSLVGSETMGFGATFPTAGRHLLPQQVPHPCAPTPATRSALVTPV